MAESLGPTARGLGWRFHKCQQTFSKSLCVIVFFSRKRLNPKSIVPQHHDIAHRFDQTPQYTIYCRNLPFFLKKGGYIYFTRRGSIPLWVLPSAYTIFYFLTQAVPLEYPPPHRGKSLTSARTKVTPPRIGEFKYAGIFRI